MDWRAYADATGADLETIKAELPLEWVISQQAGVALEERGEKSVGVCPFHPDTDPSLDVYADGKRWGCFPCGLDGDLFDFIGKYWGLTSFPAQLEQSQALLEAYTSEGGAWERVSLEEIPVVDLSQLVVEARAAHSTYEAGTKYPLAQLLEHKGLDINPDWLHEKWMVGVSSDLNVIAPYVSIDGTFVSYKTRYTGSGWYARKGGKLTSLYGEHQLKEVPADAPVWICEGETDTWLASWLLGERGVALGLPTGAGSTIRPEWVDLLRGRTVTLVFDADRAGRSAARTWHRALAGVATELRVAWPDAGDLCESSNPMGILMGGETIPSPIPVVTLTGNGKGYATLTKDGDPGAPLSNWTMTAHKRIVNTDLNGKITSKGLEAVFDDEPSRRIRVPDKVWDGGKSMLDFVKLHNRGWTGAGSKHPQGILTHMLAETPFLGTERGVEVIGLHGAEEGSPVFVLQDEVIGSPIAAERWRYTPPSTGAADFSRYHLSTKLSTSGDAFKEWAAPVIVNMMMLNHPSVMTVILAWAAAAPGRSLIREFPPLGVFGGSGTGKTSLILEVLLTMFGLDQEHNLTHTTPHGVRVWASSTNGIPVWFDEFRLGAARNTLETMLQVLRDAWTSAASSRGGYGDNKQDVHESRASAPLIVSGEEALEERSHVDRVVAVSLAKRDLNPGALRGIQVARGRDGRGRLGRSYLEWFTRELAADRLGVPRTIPDRMAQGEAVLEWGWGLWSRYTREVAGVDVTQTGGLDLSGVRGERESAVEHPLVAALEEALAIGAMEPGVHDGLPVAWIVEHAGAGKKSVVAVRIRAFQRWAENAGYHLPGGERSTHSWMSSRWVTKGDGRAAYGFGSAVVRVRALQLIGVLEESDAMEPLPSGEQPLTEQRPQT